MVYLFLKFANLCRNQYDYLFLKLQYVLDMAIIQTQTNSENLIPVKMHVSNQRNDNIYYIILQIYACIRID